MTDAPTNPAAVVEQVDRDALEQLDDALGFLTHDEREIALQALARHRLLGIEQGRAIPTAKERG